MSPGLRCLTMLLCAALAGSLSCNPDITEQPPARPPEPGRLTVVLTTPRSDDGGIVLEIRGHATGTPVRSDTAMFMFSERMDSALTRVVLVGNLRTGPVLWFDVSDTRQPYSATIIQVSDQANVVREHLQDYSLDVSAFYAP